MENKSALRSSASSSVYVSASMRNSYIYVAIARQCIVIIAVCKGRGQFNRWNISKRACRN